MQFAVCSCQRVQNSPLVGDQKETNKVVKDAKLGKDKVLKIKKVAEDDLALYAFHDAAWGNVPDPNAEPKDEAWLGKPH